MITVTPDGIRSDIDKVNKRIERIRATLSDAEQIRDALQLTLDFYLQPPSKAPRAHQDVSSDDLRNMKLKEAVSYLAERNAGEFHSTPARDLLIEAGVIHEANSKQTIYQLLSTWNAFENVRRGVYHLVEAPMIKAVK